MQLALTIIFRSIYHFLTSKTWLITVGILITLNGFLLLAAGGIANDKDKELLIIKDLENRGLIENLPNEISDSVRLEIKFWQEAQHPKASSASDQLGQYIAELDENCKCFYWFHYCFIRIFLFSFALKILRICIARITR